MEISLKSHPSPYFTSLEIAFYTYLAPVLVSIGVAALIIEYRKRKRKM
jgi:hypothetical protein